MHQHTQQQFGLTESNYIGTLFQQNNVCDTWSEFYTTQRIMPLMQTALEQQKCTLSDMLLAEELYKKLDAIFPDEAPALLHGDLWSGNYMVAGIGSAVVYDPAVYYGHREMDIAMTLLFGGFDQSFYQYYNEMYPLQNGWRSRMAICQLYPLLVHLILFGGHYYDSVRRILKQYA